MNAIDVADGFKNMLKMKGYKCSAAEQLNKGRTGNGIRELSRELGISPQKISTYLSKLFEPKYVREAIIKDSSKFTAIDETKLIPETIKVGGKKIKFREAVKKAVASGEIVGKLHVRRLAKLAKLKPEKAEVELNRAIKKQSSDANRILDKALDLQFALKESTPDKWTDMDKNAVRSQLGSVTGAVRNFTGRINESGKLIGRPTVPV